MFVCVAGCLCNPWIEFGSFSYIIVRGCGLVNCVDHAPFFFLHHIVIGADFHLLYLEEF